MDIIYLNGTHIRVNALWMVKTKNTYEELNDYFCTHCNSIVLILQGTYHSFTYANKQNISQLYLQVAAGNVGFEGTCPSFIL